MMEDSWMDALAGQTPPASERGPWVNLLPDRGIVAKAVRFGAAAPGEACPGGHPSSAASAPAWLKILFTNERIHASQQSVDTVSYPSFNLLEASAAAGALAGVAAGQDHPCY